MNEGEPQVRFYNGVSCQQVLDFLQLILAFLGGGIELSPHREILEQLQDSHRRTWKTQRAEVCNRSSFPERRWKNSTTPTVARLC